MPVFLRCAHTPAIYIFVEIICAMYNFLTPLGPEVIECARELLEGQAQ
jgi:hypothetical protein